MNDDATTTTTAEEADTEVLPVADQAPVSETPATEKPHLSRGIDLIGKYEGSGFKEPPYIVRRADGQVIQLAPLLYLIAELADGERTNEEIAAAVSEAIERGVSADNVRQLIEKRLRPLGVIAPADGSEPELQKADPLLALRLRAALVPERVVNAITKVFKPLFFPPVVLAVLAGLGALDVWLFAYHGIAQSLREVLYSPALLMMMLGLVILSAAFHECGHATACAYGGARPGVMGAGLYIVWPAFYTDVTDAYRLGKRGRLRTDLGGVYFNVVFMLATAGVYALTGYEPLLLVIPFMHLEILHQFLPFIRLDGYYIVSDLTGVPDMFARIRPTLASMLPWRQTSERVTELKPWVRVVVTAYVFTVVPLLLFMFGMMAMNAPRVFGTAYGSFFSQYHKVQHAFANGGTLAGSIGIVQILILILPAAGIVATFWMAFRRTAGALWVRTEGYPAIRVALVGASTAVAAALAYVWWPGADYHPIQRGERGTFQDAARQFHRLHRLRPTLPKVPTENTQTRPTTHELPTTTTATTTHTTTNRTTSTGTGGHPPVPGRPPTSPPSSAAPPRTPTSTTTATTPAP